MSDSGSDLDDLLDSVLDDFDDTEGNSEVKSKTNDEFPTEQTLEKMMEQMQTSPFGQQLQQLMENGAFDPIKAESGSSVENPAFNPSQDGLCCFNISHLADLKLVQELIKSLETGMQPPTDPSCLPKTPPKNFQEGLDAAMKMISEGDHHIGRDPQYSQDEDAFFEKLLEEFKDVDPSDQSSMDQMMEKMMSEMLSKESLLPPLQQVCGIYPEWLSSHKEDTGFDNYQNQFDCFLEMKSILENTDSVAVSPRVIELMGKVQEFGNPPPEILLKLMPGVTFDENGNPNMPELDFNGQGGMPSFPGLPLPSDDPSQPCVIM